MVEKVNSFEVKTALASCVRMEKTKLMRSAMTMAMKEVDMGLRFHSLCQS